MPTKRNPIRNSKTSMASVVETEPDCSEQKKDQPRQIEEFVPKGGATSVLWTWFGYEKSDTDQKSANYAAHRSPQQTQMRGTKELSGAQIKPQSQMLKQAFARSMPYSKD